MALNNEQKEIIERVVSDTINEGEFKKMYESCFQKIVNEADVSVEDLEEAQEYFSEKLKEII